MSCNFCLTRSVLQHHTRLLLCVPMPSCFKSHTHDCSFSVSICNVAGRFVQLFAETCNLCQEINTPSGTMAKKIFLNYTLSRKKKRLRYIMYICPLTFYLHLYPLSPSYLTTRLLLYLVFIPTTLLIIITMTLYFTLVRILFVLTLPLLTTFILCSVSYFCHIGQTLVRCISCVTLKHLSIYLSYIRIYIYVYATATYVNIISFTRYINSERSEAIIAYG